MTTDSDVFRSGPTRATTVRTATIIGVVAFLVGLAVMATTIAMFGEHWLDAAPERPAQATRQQPRAVAEGETARPDAATLDMLAVREAALDRKMDMLEDRLANVDTSSRVASGFATRAEGLMVAFAARRALDRGLPLGYIEGQLRERFGTIRPRAVATVIGAADTPTTLEDLRLALDQLSPRLSSADPDKGWWANLNDELGSLIVIRQATTPSPRPVERLRRARRMLDAGQVEGALAEVARTPGAGQAESWMRAARRYINARRALDAIETTALEGGGVQPAPPSAPVASPTPRAATLPDTGGATAPQTTD